MRPCPCGAEPVRRKSKGRNGKMRIRVECPACGMKTRWHNLHGGHVLEWERKAGGSPRP